MRVPWCQPLSYDMGKRSSNFQFRFSFTHAIGKRNSRFCFRFVFSYYIENGIPTSISFCPNFGRQISKSHFLFSSSVFVRYRKSEFELRFSFLVSVILSLSYFTWTGRMFALPVAKAPPNDSNISTQHIPTLLAQHLQAPAKRSQHFSATDRNIVGGNMLHAFRHQVATCCYMLGVESRTSAHAWAQHCCTNLAKRLQHHATSTNVAWKIWPFSNLSQQHPTCRDTVAINARNMLHPTMLRHATLKCCDRLAGA